MPKRLIFWSIVCILLLTIILIFVAPRIGRNKGGIRIDTSKWDENFDTKPIPEDQIPIIEIVNQSFLKTELQLEKGKRIKFINKDSENYTLMIPLIGIEEPLDPDSVFEPTFYKEGEIEFWLKELGENKTKGIVNVTVSETS